VATGEIFYNMIALCIVGTKLFTLAPFLFLVGESATGLVNFGIAQGGLSRMWRVLRMRVGSHCEMCLFVHCNQRSSWL
jgi:hypothetical protein